MLQDVVNYENSGLSVVHDLKAHKIDVNWVIWWSGSVGHRRFTDWDIVGLLPIVVCSFRLVGEQTRNLKRLKQHPQTVEVGNIVIILI